MTVHLIEYDDVTYLGFNIGYLDELPRRIEAFKIKLDLVPAAEYGKYREPALDQTVSTARAGASLWRDSSTRIRSLHQETKATLATVIELMDASALDSRLGPVTQELQRHAQTFKQQQTECDRIIECATNVIPRFMDFMNVRTFEYAKRKGLVLKGPASKLPETLSSALTDEQSLTSAKSTVTWNHRAFSTATLSASNMGAYCARLSGLLDATAQRLNSLHEASSPRRRQVSCQVAASSAREAQRLVNYTFDHILRFSF